MYGKVVLYHYGKGSLPSKKSFQYSIDIPTNYISSGLTGDIYPTAFNGYKTGMHKNQRKHYNKFQETFPQYQKLYACADDSYDEEVLFKCMLDYNAENYTPAKFEKNETDLGDIDVLWKNVDDIVPIPAKYIFTNTGSTPLKIEKINKLTYMTVSFTEGEILPGQKGEILVKMDIADGKSRYC